MSNLPPATHDNLPTNGLDTILYHSAYLTTPNPWEGVRRSWKETEALTNAVKNFLLFFFWKGTENPLHNLQSNLWQSPIIVEPEKGKI